MPESGIKNGFEEVEYAFPFRIFYSGKIELPFQMLRCSRKFSAVTTQKVVFHLHSSQTFKILFVNDKQPPYYL